MTNSSYVSIHFKKPLTRSSFLSKSVVIFAEIKTKSVKMTTLFERNEDRVTGFLKWRDFRIGKWKLKYNLWKDLTPLLQFWEVSRKANKLRLLPFQLSSQMSHSRPLLTTREHSGYVMNHSTVLSHTHWDEFSFSIVTNNIWLLPKHCCLSGNPLGIWICRCRCILESSEFQNSGCT